MEPAPHVKDVLILDVTRMDLGRICMAGVSRDETQTLNNIRPVVPFKNLTREFLNQSGITPYSVVRFNFSKAVGVRPHVEDFAFDFQNPSSFVIIRKCGAKVVKPILEETHKKTPAGIFGEHLIDNKFVYKGEHGHSLGCLNANRVSNIWLECEDRIRIRFALDFDQGQATYTSNELKLISWIQSKLKTGVSGTSIIDELKERLRQFEPLHVRLGLTRPFRSDTDQDPDPREKCYAQILGIHTFPDYLA